MLLAEPVTGEERQRLRTLVDDAKRRRLRVEMRRCVGCGCRYIERTVGCQTCSDRVSHRRRHPNGQRRFGLCSRCGTPWDDPAPDCPTCARRVYDREHDSRRLRLEGS